MSSARIALLILVNGVREMEEMEITIQDDCRMKLFTHRILRPLMVVNSPYAWIRQSGFGTRKDRLTWDNQHDQIANAEHLNIHSVGRPLVRSVSVTLAYNSALLISGKAERRTVFRRIGFGYWQATWAADGSGVTAPVVKIVQ